MLDMLCWWAGNSLTDWCDSEQQQPRQTKGIVVIQAEGNPIKYTYTRAWLQDRGSDLCKNLLPWEMSLLSWKRGIPLYSLS